MCLYTKDLTCKIAEEPITVYKVIRYDNTSIVRNFKYVKNRINEQVELCPVVLTNILNHIAYEVNAGYHSFKSIDISLKDIYNFSACSYELINGFVKISKFIIPKGSMYYENDYSIVSNRIIYKSDISLTRIKLFHYRWYRKIK